MTRLSPPGTHLTAESTEAMRIKCLAQGNNILLPGFEPSTPVSNTDILTNRPICSYTEIYLYTEIYYPPLLLSSSARHEWLKDVHTSIPDQQAEMSIQKTERTDSARFKFKPRLHQHVVSLSKTLNNNNNNGYTLNIYIYI